MALRRLPLLLLLALLAATACTPIVDARAQQVAYDDQGGGTYGDGAYDDPYEDADGTDVADDDQDADGDDDRGPWPTPTPTPTPTVAPPPTPTPVGPAPVPAPIAPAPMTPALPTIPITKTVAGTVAQLRTDGKAAIPRGAPKRVQAVIAAANQIVGKPYKWGGGHAKLVDRGYDCSGAVSYALIGAQLLGAPLVSGSLAHWSAGGAGRWISIYANKGHVYMEIAGLRLDTSPVGDVTRRSGVRWRPLIGRRGGFSTRHPAGL